MKIIFTSETEKQYGKLKTSDQRKINKKITLLHLTAHLGKKLSGEFSGLYSLKAWPYRIVYLIKDTKKEIWIVTIAHRQGVYK